MMKLVRILLAIILCVPSSMDGYVLPERAEFSLDTDSQGAVRVGEDSEELRVHGLEKSEKEIDYNGTMDSRSFGTSDSKLDLETPYRGEIVDNNNPQEANKEAEYHRDDEAMLEQLKKLIESKKWEHDQYEKKKDGKPVAHLFNSVMISRPRGNLSELQRGYYSESVELSTDNADNEEKQGTLNAKKDSSSAVQFSYTQPNDWFIDSPECSGRLQSPVNFESEKLIGLDVPSDLIWTGYWNHPDNLTIYNTGHSVELRGIWKDGETPSITGGPLIGDYEFVQLHFHWSEQDFRGSEHTIDNKSFAMEMHMVHYNKNHGKYEDALKQRDGLAVVAFFFEMNERPSSGLNLFVNSLNRIQEKPGIAYSVRPYPLGLLHPTFELDYASYIGSLTTPPCQEIVTWLLSARPLPVSNKQLESFRKISNEWSSKENCRPKQALNGRTLYYVGN